MTVFPNIGLEVYDDRASRYQNIEHILGCKALMYFYPFFTVLSCKINHYDNTFTWQFVMSRMFIFSEKDLIKERCFIITCNYYDSRMLCIRKSFGWGLDDESKIQGCLTFDLIFIRHFRQEMLFLIEYRYASLNCSYDLDFSYEWTIYPQILFFEFYFLDPHYHYPIEFSVNCQLNKFYMMEWFDRKWKL